MAVVGVGHFGRFHAEKIARSKNARLVAVADIDRRRAAEVARAVGCDAVSDFRDLYGKVDAVTIAVPTHAHYDVARAFMEAGVHVLVEKPVTDDLALADRLIEIARQKDLVFQVGHQMRFTGMVEAVLKRLHRPLFIESIRITPFRGRGTDVNVILDLMIHDIDLILALVDAPILSVDAAGAPVFSDSEDIASARLKFGNGCIANITASRISLKTERRTRIFQPDTYMAVDFDQHTIRTVSRTGRRMPPGLPPVEISEETYQEVDALESEIEAFASAVVDRKPPLVPGEAGREALKAAVMINESLRAHADFVAKAGAAAPTVQAAG
jgi:predicted dehydrogenase